MRRTSGGLEAFEEATVVMIRIISLVAVNTSLIPMRMRVAIGSGTWPSKILKRGNMKVAKITMPMPTVATMAG